MATLDIKFTKFDNRPWGFRLAGGHDFPEPLSVIRVAEESLAECMGLKVGDVVVKLNDQPVDELTHAKAHEALTLAGNNFVMTVKRAEDPEKFLESIEDKVEPFMKPIERILFDPIEEIAELTPDEVSDIKDECPCEEASAEPAEPAEDAPPVEVYPEKPRDHNSEKIANPNLTEEEIAALILDEEEVLNEKGVLGVDFKKIRPRVPLLRQSQVLKEIQQVINEGPTENCQVNLKSVFLQKPDRPVPKPRRTSQSEDNSESEGYKVVIKKQPKKSVTERLLAKGLIEPGSLRTSESEKTTPAATPEPTRDQAVAAAETAEAGSRPESKAEITEIVDTPGEPNKEATQEEQTNQPRIEEPPEDSQATEAKPASEGEPAQAQVTLRRPSTEVDVEVAVTMDRDKIKELVTTEISLERQLESVQNQLMALKQLPSEIEKHLKIVSEQLHKIMELSGVEQEQLAKADAEEERQRQLELDDDQFSTDSSSWAPHLISTEDDTWCDSLSKELEISVKSNDGEKKVIVSYESTVEETKPTGDSKNPKDAQSPTNECQKSPAREPTPAESDDSFEPDPNMSLQEQLVQELKYRKQKKARSNRDLLWQPQARQLELTYGRKWRCPNDFFNDDMIADALTGQAEVIRGRAMGVNFKKFEKKSLPNFDHLQNSSVYRMIHKIEAEPKKGIAARPPKVPAAEDIIERVNTPVFGMSESRASARSVSH